MWLVNLALRRPYTVWVGMLLVLVLGVMSYKNTPTDILPNLKVPVVVVFASYRGMPAPDMEQSVTAVLERALTKCDHLEHIESRSLLGIGIVKVYFHSSVDADLAASQVVSIVASEIQNLPPGMLMPTIMKYDATAVPVGNLVVSSPTRDDKFLLDLTDYKLREELATIEGLASAPVFGGVFRQVQIYVHPQTLEAMGLSPLAVAQKVNSQSLVIPTGEMRIGKQNYYVSSNAMIATPEDFKKIPISSDGRKIIYLGDVADVVDGQRWRTNIVHVDGRKAVYMPLLRQSGASAVAVVDAVKSKLAKDPQTGLTPLHDRGVVPEDVSVEVAFDQAQYVRDALSTLTFEGILGAVLASLVVLLFLGNLRATLIVALSIPLSILFAFIGLNVTGQTLNIMTLGGLALVLGRVVDDTIVDVENTTRHLNMDKPPLTAVQNSAREIAVPVLMATVTTCIVFFPLTVMSGIGKYLFTPLAISASLAMFASYIVSRTVSPAACVRLLKPHHEGAPREPLSLRMLILCALWMGAWVGLWALMKSNLFLLLASLGVVVPLIYWISPWFDHLFEGFARLYVRALDLCLRRRVVVAVVLLGCLVPAVLAFRGLGRELFPEVDASEFTVHMRATGGPRVEETERQVKEIEDMLSEDQKGSCQRLIFEVFLAHEAGDQVYLQEIREKNPGKGEKVLDSILAVARISDGAQQRQELARIEKEQNGKTFVIPPVIPPIDQDLVLSNIGLSSRWSAIYTPNNGPHAAFVRVQLRSGFAGRHTPTDVYVQRLRRKLAFRWPTYDFFFETGGMIRRILNAGALAPVEVQVQGRDPNQRRHVARLLNKEFARLDSVQETYLPQGMDMPQLKINVDRAQAIRPGLVEGDIVRNVITALMSSAQIAPNFWIDPKTGNPYVIGVQYPEYAVDSLQTLETIPITGLGGGSSAQSSRSGAGAAGGKPPVVRLKDVAEIQRGQAPIEAYHYDVNKVSQLFVNGAGNDLSRLSSDVAGVVSRLPLVFALDRLPEDKRALAKDAAFLSHLEEYLRQKNGRGEELRQTIQKEHGIDPATLKIPREIRVQTRGEARIMEESFGGMAFSLLLAVVFVYLIMAAQFQSWLDPLIMIVAAPLGLIGVTCLLWLTGSTLNVQSLMGVLMMVGISVSNSVLLVEFANEKLHEGRDPLAAAALAARVRLRPILMTSIAAIFGLLPMALHLHPGDEMNLPLARAVIGGLLSSTLLTLFVVPVLYVALKPRSSQPGLAVAGGPAPEAPSGDPVLPDQSHATGIIGESDAAPARSQTPGGLHPLSESDAAPARERPGGLHPTTERESHGPTGGEQ
jgi:multidrug efflux pump subunit AcrB